MKITFLFVAMLSFLLSLKVPINLLITLCSSLFHETGHLIAMVSSGNPPQSISFELTGMNIKRLQSVNISAKNEVLIALGGPFFNALLFFTATLVYCFFKFEILITVASINLIIMTFNLLPVNKLDGGMALYFLLSQKFDDRVPEKILKITSVIFIILMYLWGVYVFAVSKFNVSILIIAFFLTISMFGKSEY